MVNIPLSVWTADDLAAQGYKQITVITDDGIANTGWDLSNPKMPGFIYWQGDGIWVKARIASFEGAKALAGKKTTNTQKFRQGDWYIWPSDTPDDQLTVENSWTVKGFVFKRTYQEGEFRGLYVVATKVGRIRAARVQAPFFTMTVDNQDKPFFYEPGHVLIEQVDAEGNSFPEQRDFYGNPFEKFLAKYVRWEEK